MYLWGARYSLFIHRRIQPLHLKSNFHSVFFTYYKNTLVWTFNIMCHILFAFVQIMKNLFIYYSSAFFSSHNSTLALLNENYYNKTIKKIQKTYEKSN